MDQDQLNFHTMMGKLKAHFQGHRSAWSNEPLLTDPVATLLALHDRIEAAASAQEGGKIAAFSAKDALFAEAAVETDKLATTLRTFARRAADPVLLKAMDLSLRDFKTGAQADRVRLMNRVLAEAESRLAHLAPYRIDAARLAALKTLLHQAADQHDDGHEQRTHSTVATGRLADLLAEARTLLEGLDDDVPTFIDDAEFVTAYFVARRITDRRATRPAEAPAEAGGRTRD
ncbi:hypothetical protein [Flaviaesturariibacter aridisoli]|uniref:Uncharacterized protein n=1 Tax=Flaviaesturariibacter aridisoli TaxID=2545761 RepID=A0A4V2WM10_9BACT|nr:hypothetical protein [Flaviaesturariibacter aridisoli]TCZ65852.1 hypothetical protein E0486_16955 [Flaviaesturariibacter aridisoli]